jgi:hypothetical protein
MTTSDDRLFAELRLLLAAIDPPPRAAGLAARAALAAGRRSPRWRARPRSRLV